MITNLLIETHCTACAQTRDHELNTVACEIECQYCRTVTLVSAHYVQMMVEGE